MTVIRSSGRIQGKGEVVSEAPSNEDVLGSGGVPSKNEYEFGLNGTLKLLDYADDINLFDKNKNTIKRNTNSLYASKKF
jgi:hypothetical protein